MQSIAVEFSFTYIGFTFARGTESDFKWGCNLGFVRISYFKLSVLDTILQAQEVIQKGLKEIYTECFDKPEGQEDGCSSEVH